VSADRREQLRSAAAAYFDGLQRGDLTAVPWRDDAVLRTPIAPGGSEHPISGGDDVRAFFEAIAPGITGVTLLATYYSDDLTSVACRADIELAAPPCVLRVIDRFDVDDAGAITAQENHFDPRPALG
jgi:hypothetical protein